MDHRAHARPEALGHIEIARIMITTGDQVSGESRGDRDVRDRAAPAAASRARPGRGEARPPGSAGRGSTGHRVVLAADAPALAAEHAGRGFEVPR